jgi:hypothetical protein
MQKLRTKFHRKKKKKITEKYNTNNSAQNRQNIKKTKRR